MLWTGIFFIKASQGKHINKKQNKTEKQFCKQKHKRNVTIYIYRYTFYMWLMQHGGATCCCVHTNQQLLSCGNAVFCLRLAYSQNHIMKWNVGCHLKHQGDWKSNFQRKVYNNFSLCLLSTVMNSGFLPTLCEQALAFSMQWCSNLVTFPTF